MARRFPLGYTLLLVAVIPLGIWLGGSRGPTICGKGFDRELSPDGIMIAEKLLLDCQYEDREDYGLSIRRRDEAPSAPGALLLRISHRDSVGAKWLGNTKLMIASSRLADLLEKPEQAGEISLTYKTYSTTKPDEVFEPEAKTLDRRQVQADIGFHSDAGVGGTGAGCYISSKFDGAPAVDTINMWLAALKFSAAKAWVGTDLKDFPAHYSVSLGIGGHSDYTRSVPFPTAAAVGGVHSAVESGFRDGDWIRERTASTAPAGNLMPVWQSSWTLGDGDVIAILGQMLTGDYETALGFWLDNREIVYAARAPAAPEAIARFWRCLKENDFPVALSRH